MWIVPLKSAVPNYFPCCFPNRNRSVRTGPRCERNVKAGPLWAIAIAIASIFSKRENTPTQRLCLQFCNCFIIKLQLLKWVLNLFVCVVATTIANVNGNGFTQYHNTHSCDVTIAINQWERILTTDWTSLMAMIRCLTDWQWKHFTSSDGQSSRQSWCNRVHYNQESVSTGLLHQQRSMCHLGGIAAYVSVSIGILRTKMWPG